MKRVPKPEARALQLAYERRYRAAHGTDEPFSLDLALRLIQWLGTPEGKAAFKAAHIEAYGTDSSRRTVPTDSEGPE